MNNQERFGGLDSGWNNGRRETRASNKRTNSDPFKKKFNERQKNKLEAWIRVARGWGWTGAAAEAADRHQPRLLRRRRPRTKSPILAWGHPVTVSHGHGNDLRLLGHCNDNEARS